MLENQLSRYGAISRVVPDLAPGAKLFLVCDSDDTTVGQANLGAEFPADKDGVARVYTTIQAAVNAASASRGDVVLVMPGYDHTLSRADSWATAGVTIKGVGKGSLMPTIRYGTKTDEVGVAANNVTIDGIRFLADADSTARALDLDSGFSGHVIKNCVFDFDSTGVDFRTMIRVASGRTTIEDNEFRAEDTAGCGKGIAIFGGYADFLKIKNNNFYGEFDTLGDTSNTPGAIAVDSGHDSGDTILSGLEISGNKITCISDTDMDVVAINLGGAGVTIRGLVTDNRIASYDTAANDTAVVSYGGALPLQNYIKGGDSDLREGLAGTVGRKLFDSD